MTKASQLSVEDIFKRLSQCISDTTKTTCVRSYSLYDKSLNDQSQAIVMEACTNTGLVLHLFIRRNRGYWTISFFNVRDYADPILTERFIAEWKSLGYHLPKSYKGKTLIKPKFNKKAKQYTYLVRYDIGNDVDDLFTFFEKRVCGKKPTVSVKLEDRRITK